jgi:hypothetical protein
MGEGEYDKDSIMDADAVQLALASANDCFIASPSMSRVNTHTASSPPYPGEEVAFLISISMDADALLMTMEIIHTFRMSAHS